MQQTSNCWNNKRVIEDIWDKTWSRCQSRELLFRSAISSLDKISRNSIEELIRSLEAIEESIGKLDKILSEQGKKNEDCKLLTTVPRVGIIVAMTYKTAIDNPYRFETSYTVGVYMGLSPNQYASVEIDRHGSIWDQWSVEVCYTKLHNPC